jgi:hypothetical protein
MWLGSRSCECAEIPTRVGREGGSRNGTPGANRYRGHSADAPPGLFLAVNWSPAPIIRLTLKRRDQRSGQMCRHSLLRPPSSAVQAPNLIMRVRSKSKGVDTVKAQSLTEVREPNHNPQGAIVDSPDRFLIVSRRTGCGAQPNFDLDLGPHLAYRRFRRASSSGDLRLHHWPGRPPQHPSPDMPRLQILLQ